MSRLSRAAETVSRSAPGLSPMSTRVDAGLVEDGLRGRERHDDGPPECPGQRSVAGDDADDAVVDRIAGGLHRDRRPDGQAILRGEVLGDQRAVLVRAVQRRAGDEDEVVESGIE